MKPQRANFPLAGIYWLQNSLKSSDSNRVLATALPLHEIQHLQKLQTCLAASIVKLRSHHMRLQRRPREQTTSTSSRITTTYHDPKVATASCITGTSCTKEREQLPHTVATSPFRSELSGLSDYVLCLIGRRVAFSYKICSV